MIFIFLNFLMLSDMFSLGMMAYLKYNMTTNVVGNNTMLTNFANNKTMLTNFGDNKIVFRNIDNNNILLTYLDDNNNHGEFRQYFLYFVYVSYGLFVFYDVYIFFLYFRHPYVLDSINFKVSLLLKFNIFI